MTIGSRAWLDEAVPRLSSGTLAVFAAVYKADRVIVSVAGLPDDDTPAATYALAMLEGELCGELNAAGVLQGRDGIDEFLCVAAPAV